MIHPDRTIPPAVYPLGNLVMPQVSESRLPNGITTHILDRGDDEVTRITIVIPGGQAESPSPVFPQMEMALLSEGTSRHTGPEISEHLEYNGAWLSGSADEHFRSLNLFSLNSRIADVLPLVAEMIESPSFPDHESAVMGEKLARTVELNEQRPSHRAIRALDRLVMGPDCIYARDKSAEAFRSVSGAELRAHYAATLSTSGMHIFIAGKVTDSIYNLVADTFGNLQGAGEAVPLVKATFLPDGASRVVRVDMPESMQTAVECAIPSVPRSHPDYVPLRMAVTVLGGYFGSRLMLNIREDKGFTYGIGASLRGYREGSFITVQTECDNSYTNAVLSEIRNEIVRMHNPETYTNEELIRAKSYIETNLAGQLDSPFAVMDYYINHLTVGTPADYFEAQVRELSRLDAESIAATARKYFNTDNLYTILAGPA